MYLDTTFPPPAGRLAGLMRELNALGSTDIGAAIDAMIERLDAAAGDPDLEPSGDERDASVMEGWNWNRVARPALDQEDAEDDDSDRCAARDDHVGINVRTSDDHAGDPDDAEDEPDCCEAGDDRIVAGPVLNRGYWLDGDQRHCFVDLRPGNEEDAEHDRPPSYCLDQSADLYVTAANDWPELRA